MADNNIGDNGPTSESTRLQLTSATFWSPSLKDFLLYSPLPASLKTYKLIAHDPTINLLLEYSIAMIAAAGETIEADDDVEDDVITFITRQWDKLRINLPQLIRDIYCFGWSAAEKIWMIERGYAVMCIKPLEAAITGLLIDPSTGRLSGLVQPLVLGVSNGPAVGLPIKLDLQHAVVFSYQPHGSNWYGTSILESVRQSYNSHRDADEGASRYDRNISGSHWLVTYPDGVMVDFNGVQTPAGEVAQHLLASLESSSTSFINLELIL